MKKKAGDQENRGEDAHPEHEPCPGVVGELLKPLSAVGPEADEDHDDTDRSAQQGRGIPSAELEDEHADDIEGKENGDDRQGESS